jgi:uncharacterized coiled-coil DUF342 family protein
MTQVQSDKPTPPSLEEALVPHRDARNLAKQLRAATDEINSATQNEPLPRHHNEGPPRFVTLANQLYDAAVQAAQQQVTRAENLLHQIEQEAAQVRTNAERRWDEIQALERDLEDMGSKMIQNFTRYNGGKT